MNERRLNPLSFPAETNGRFTILIVAAIVLTWLICLTLLLNLAQIQNADPRLFGALRSIAAVTDSMAARDTYIQDLPPEQIAAYFQSLRTPLRRILAAAIPWFVAPFALLLLLLGVAYFIFRTHPKRIKRRHRHDLLPPDKPPVTGIEQTVTDLAAQVGILPPPTLLIHKLVNPEYPDGQAFGLRHRYQIRLRAQLFFVQKRPQFRAMILHELGHIVNDDVGRTYFASALWVTFSVILLLLGGVVTAVLLSSPTEIGVTMPLWGLLGRILFTLLLAQGVWRSLLQIREFYADWRVASWGEEAALRQWLRTAAQHRTVRRTGWRWFMTFHPANAEREEVLADPLKLFRVTRQLPFFTGLLLAITIIGFPLLVGWLFIPLIGLVEIALTTWAASFFRSPDLANVTLFFVVNFVVKIAPLLLLILGVLLYIGYLLTTTLGVQVQRETIADMANQVVRLRSYGRLAYPAFWLTVGVQIGLILTPVGYTLPTRWPTIFLTIAWLIGFALLTWLWLAYLRALTQIILGSHVGRSDPRRGKALVTFLSSLSLAFLYPPAFLLLLWAWVGDRSVALPLVTGPDSSPVQFMAITVVMLVFLAIAYFLGAALSLIALYGALAFRSPASCPTCSEKISYKIVLGQRCPYCDEPLALWIYLDEIRPAITR